MNLARLLPVAFVLCVVSAAWPQSAQMNVPQSVTAGSAFSIPTTGSGAAALYIIGPAQALRRDVQMGEPVAFAAGDLHNAGHYLAVLVNGGSTETHEFDVVPAAQPASLSFLARPSRVAVGLHNGISGTAYVFDAYKNLMNVPASVSFELTGQSGAKQDKTVTARNGVAWTEMDSATRQGSAKFIAQANGVSSTRVIDQVPGDPCGLTISARPNGGKLEVQTSPVRDCSGNPIPDGTIVTFTETANGMQSTADVPIKKGIAQIELPAYSGARISAASGVVAGNEIHWEGR